MKSKKRFFSALLCLALALSLTQGAWAGTFTNGGTLTNGATGTIQNSGTFTNDTNGTVINNGAFTNEATGTIKNENTSTDPVPFSGNKPIVNKSTVADAVSGVPTEMVHEGGGMVNVKIPSALTGPNARNFIISDFKVKGVAVTPYMSDDTAMTYLAMQGDSFSFTLNAAYGYFFTGAPVLSVNSGNVTLNATDDTAPYQYSIKLAGNYDLTDLTLKDPSVLTSYGVNVSIRNNGNVTSGLCVEIVGDSSQYYDLCLYDTDGKQILGYGNMRGGSVCNNWRVTKEGTATTAKLFLHDNTTTEVWSGTIPSITTVISQDQSPLAADADAPSGSATSYNSATKEYTYEFNGLDFANYTYRIENSSGGAYLLYGANYTTTDRLETTGGTTYTLVATKSEDYATNGFKLTQYASISINITNTQPAS